MNEKRFLQVITEEDDHHFVLYDVIKKVKILGTTVTLWFGESDWDVISNVANVKQIISDLEGITPEVLKSLYPPLGD